MGSTGQVFADNCLVCGQQCFIYSHIGDKEENKLTACRKRRGGLGIISTPVEIRQTIYKAFDVRLKPEDVMTSRRVNDLPLCISCTFKVGQLKSIQNQLTHLERQYEKLREEIAFSIVDIVASNPSNNICTNIANQHPNAMLKKLKEFEVETLQQLVFEKWHESSYADFDQMDDEEQVVSSVEIAVNSLTQLEKTPAGSQSRKSSTDSWSTSSKLRERQSSISITKVENGNESELLDAGVEEDSTEYPEDNSEGTSHTDPHGFMIDEEFEQEDETEDRLNYPFSLEIAEYSASMQNGSRSEYIDDGDDDTVGDLGLEDSHFGDEGELAYSSEPQQNLEIFRDKSGLYECEFCQKKFIHKYPFRDHLRVHFGDGPRCKICNKIFPKKHNLMLHLRTHSGEKPYVCTVCSKGFADKSNLKVHMRVHTGERPYKCEYCHVAFSNSSRLVVHKRTHTGEKPFTCEICGRKCTTRNQLSTHRKTHFQSGRNSKSSSRKK